MGLLDRFKRRNAAASTPPISAGTRSESASEYVSPYMPAERAAELLVLGVDGMPPLHLAPYRGEWWLAEDSTGLLVNVGTRQLRQLGVWSVRVRGDSYAHGTLRLGLVELVREADNSHDRNAVAIHQSGEHCGYWNKGMARSLAERLDGGYGLTAVAISVTPPKVIAAAPDVMEHLARTTSGGLSAV